MKYTTRFNYGVIQNNIFLCSIERFKGCIGDDIYVFLVGGLTEQLIIFFIGKIAIKTSIINIIKPITYPNNDGFFIIILQKNAGKWSSVRSNNAIKRIEIVFVFIPYV